MSSLTGGPGRRKRLRFALLTFAATFTLQSAWARAQQPAETLPFFLPDQAFDNHGVDNINLYNGDDGIAIPLGPAYTLGPTGYQFQLTAFHTVKFWHFSTATCSINTQFAWVAGDPTLGVGWTLSPGYVVKRSPPGVTPFWEYYSPNGGVSQVTLPATSPYSATTTDGSHLRITAAPNSTNPTSYTVESPDGSIQTFDHAYARPVATPSSVDFSNLEYGEGGANRYGLGNIKDRFGNTLVSVAWSGTNPSEVSTITLSPFGSQISFTWTSYSGSTGFSRRVLDHVRFPAPGSLQLNVQFAYQDGIFARNSFDTSAAGSGCTVSPTQAKVPELTSIAFSDPGSPASIIPFSYAMTYLGTPGVSVQKQGTINKMTLPTGGQVTYDYCITAKNPCNIGVNCDPSGTRTPAHCDPTQAPEPLDDGPEAPDNYHPPLQNFIDKSPGVAVRTEYDPYASRTATVYYDRDQFRGLLDGVPDDLLVIRRTSVTVYGNDDVGASNYLRRNYFKVDSPDPFNPRGAAGIELDRRYYSGTDPTQTPVRTVISCYSAGGCGYGDDSGEFIDYDFTASGRTPSTGNVTWYGAIPAGIYGGICSSTSTKCTAVKNTNYNATAGRYDTTELSSTLPNSVTRTVDINWTPSTATGHWILDLFDHRWTWDGGGTNPPAGSNGDTVVRQDVTFDSEGFLQSARTWDSVSSKAIRQCSYNNATDGTPVNEYSQTFTSGSEPTGNSCGSIPSTGTDGDAFGQSHTSSNLLLTQSNWRKGTGTIGWNSFDVVRDSSTGFITESRDPNYAANTNLKTTYTYDALGRVVKIQPPGGSTVEWPTTFCYIPQVSGSTGLVIVKKVIQTPDLNPNSTTGICKRDDGIPAAGSGPILGQQLDGFGRVVRELRRNNKALSSGAYFETKDTRYDKAGHIRFASDWKPCAGTTNINSCAVNEQSSSGPGTVFVSFDALGRSEVFADVDSLSLANYASKFIIDRTDSRVSPSIGFSDTYQQTQAICVGGTWSGSTCTGGIGGDTGAYSATEFDNLGRITKVTETNPTSGILSSDTTTYSYNVLDQLKKVTQGSQTRNFTYSAFGFLKSEQTPENGQAGNATTNYTLYGSLGNLLTKTDGSPTLTTYDYTYDAAGRLTLLKGAGSEFVSNCYDGTGACGDTAISNFAGGLYPKSRLTRRVGINQIPFQAAPVYDDFTYSATNGRLSAETTSVGARVTDLTKNGFSLPVTQSWTYNTLGAIATHALPRPAGSSTTLTVNDSAYTSGFLTNITATKQGGTTQQILSANYHESGRLTDYTTGSATPYVKTTIAANSVIPSRPASITSVNSPGGSTLFQTGAYAYDGLNSIKAMGSDTFAYDGRSRLTSAFYSGTGGGTQGFTYDRYGNLTSKTGINPATLTTTAGTNHLSSSIGTYDDRGNLITFVSGAQTQTQFHDLLNRLYRTVDISGTDFTYLYDGGGERVAKFPTTGGATRREFARVIIEGRGDTSLSCTPDPFTDVTCAANPNDGKYVQKMKDIGITSGCGGGAYCPDAQTQRDQASVFFLKGEASHCPLNVNGCTYTPPSCTTTHVFADVPCPSQYADWVGQLYQEGVTAGCGNNNFCPTDPLGSWQMLAWANKIWGSYYPLPRASVLTYRDEGARVTTEANQTSSSGDSSVVITYPRDNIFLGSQLVSSAVWSGTTPSYQFYAVDHLGTPRLVTNISAASVQTRKFWPYGDDGPTTGSDAGQRLKLAGMERDSENKHYYDHARTEDFNIGRFVSAEPAWQGAPNSPQSWNRYSVDNNNPVSFVDPDGAIPIPIAIALGGGLVNGAVGLLEYRSGHPTAGFWDQARRFGLDFATGFAGTLAAESGLFGEGALAAAIGSTLTSIGNQWVARESFSVADAALSGLLGATSFGVASHLGPRPGTFLAARWTNRSLSDFFTMTNVGKQTAVGLAGAGLEAESSLIASFPRLGGGGSASQNPLGEGYFYYQLFWFQFQQHYGNAPSGQPTQPYNPNVICVGVPDGKGKIHRVCQ